MGHARHKLNVAYLNGCLLFAGFFGLGAQSWNVFLALSVFFAVWAMASGAIRLRPVR